MNSKRRNPSLSLVLLHRVSLFYLVDLLLVGYRMINGFHLKILLDLIMLGLVHGISFVKNNSSLQKNATFLN